MTSPADATTPTLTLARWTVTSGSNIQSRGAVVIASGEHQWEASAEGNGPVDALFRAVDRAISGILTGHPRLLAYDLHSLGEGTGARGAVTLRIGPPEAAVGARAEGSYEGEASSENIIAASVAAYLIAINRMLAEEHWAGAAESAGNQRRAARDAQGRAEMDEQEGHHDTTAWFDR
jgi:hypothetical protein